MAGSKHLSVPTGKEIERAACKQGWRVKLHNASHRTLYPPSGGKPITITTHKSSPRVEITRAMEARKAGLLI